jgi:hypothetical protein
LSAGSGLLVIAVALAGYQTLGITTPIWVLGVLFFVQGAGMGSVMPPTTDAVMSVVPRERAGAGSALTNTARQVSGALGVAILGSILSQVYRGQLSPHLTALPAQARGPATASIEATQTVAGRLGPAGRNLAGFADAAFVHAMHVTTLISAAITLVGVLVVLIWMPGRRALAGLQAGTNTPVSTIEAAATQAEPALTGAAAPPAAGTAAVALTARAEPADG